VPEKISLNPVAAKASGLKCTAIHSDIQLKFAALNILYLAVHKKYFKNNILIS
jgi:hypothetical protein